MVSDSAYTVQGHGVHTAFVELANALRRLSDQAATAVDVAVNIRRPADITHIHTVGWHGLRHLLGGSGKKVVSAHVVPGSFVGSLIGADLWHSYMAIYLRWFYNRADIVLAPTENTKKELEKLGVIRPVIVFPNLINTRRYETNAELRRQSRNRHGITAGQFVVVGNGQLQPRKRVDLFIGLAEQLPGITFVWVGGMPFGRMAASAKRMEEMIKNAPANFRCTGTVPLKDVADYYHLADAFIALSEQETFGLAVIEAAAAGLPLVLRDIRGYNRAFRECSIMVGDNSFKDIILRLRDDKAFWRRYHGLALNLAKNYDSRAGVKRLLAIYQDLLVDAGRVSKSVYNGSNK